MAAKNNRRQSGSIASGEPIADLYGFLEGFTNLTVLLAEGMTAQSTNADEREVVAGLAKPLNEQVSRLAEFIRNNTQNISAQTALEIGHVLHLNAADSMVKSGAAISRSLSSVTARIGLGDLFNLIKKVLRSILKLIFGSISPWLDALIELIDEIINGLLGMGSPKLASTLSHRHQDYLAELTHLEGLIRATSWVKRSEDDEE